jgi:hypothetical protein
VPNAKIARAVTYCYCVELVVDDVSMLQQYVEFQFSPLFNIVVKTYAQILFGFLSYIVLKSGGRGGSRLLFTTLVPVETFFSGASSSI